MVKELVKLNTLEKRIILGLFALIITLFFSYGYLIESSVKDIVERKDVEKEIALLNSKLGSLELDYVALRDTIGGETASNLGFVEAKNVAFIEKIDSNIKLTLKDEE